MQLLIVSIAFSQTCSHGTACNFIHCFRNPGGDYEWADSDKPPPRYWVKKMASLFGYVDESGNDKHTELEHWDKLGKSRKSMSTDVDDRYLFGVTMISNTLSLLFFTVPFVFLDPNFLKFNMHHSASFIC